MELLNLFDPFVWLVVFAIAGFIYVTFQKTIYGVYLVCGLLPAYLIRMTAFGIPITFLELMILSLFIVWILADDRWKRINYLFSKKSTNPIPLLYRIPLTLLLISALSGLIVAGGSSASLGILKAYFIEPILFLVVFVYEIRSYKQLQNVIRILGILTATIGVIALIQYMTGYGIENPLWAAEGTRRVTTLFGYPNAASLLLAPIVALFVGYAHQKNLPLLEKIFIIVVITLGTLVVITAQTTGALFALIIVGVIVLIEKKRTRSLTIAFFVIVITLSLNTSAFTDTISSVSERINTNFLDLNSTSLEIRVNQWRETFNLLLERPILGAGLAGYQSALQPFHEYDFLEIYLYPHNIFFNAWTELGLLGLLAFIWMLLLVFSDLTGTIGRTKYELRKNIGKGILYAWIIILIHGMVDVPFFKNDLSVLFMILLGSTILVTTEKISHAS